MVCQSLFTFLSFITAQILFYRVSTLLVVVLLNVAALALVFGTFTETSPSSVSLSKSLFKKSSLVAAYLKHINLTRHHRHLI
jgi:hypothetical protein